MYYPYPLHHQPALLQATHAPTATHLCTRLLALPVHAGVDEGDVDRVLAAIHQAVSA